MNDYFDRKASPAPESTGAEEPPPYAPAGAKPVGREDDSTPQPLKSALQELLKYGLVEQAAKPNIYRTLLRERTAVAAMLEPLDLTARFDEVRGIVYLVVAETAATDSDEAWRHPLLRRQRLTTEQSLLVAILRQYFVAYEQDCGIGAAGASVDLDELLAQFNLYLGGTGSEQRDIDRLKGVVDQLHRHGICANPDKENRVAIRPIIVHLANPEQLQLLLAHFQKLKKDFPAEAEPETPEGGEDA